MLGDMSNRDPRLLPFLGGAVCGALVVPHTYYLRFIIASSSHPAIWARVSSAVLLLTMAVSVVDVRSVFRGDNRTVSPKSLGEMIHVGRAVFVPFLRRGMYWFLGAGGTMGLLSLAIELSN